MMTWIRQRFELFDLVLLVTHLCALAVLLPLHAELDHFGTALWQSSALILADLFVVFQVRHRLKLAMVVRMVILILSCPWGYERANDVIHVLRGTPEFEASILGVEAYLFGGNASVWLEALHHPLLTEWLQASYITYFFIPLTVGVMMMASGRWKEMGILMFAVVLASHQNFFFYVLVPIRSPFLVAELPEFAGLIHYNFDLHGLWLTDTIRQGLLDSTTMRYDCFPSGHTCLTTTTLLIAWRYHRKAFWVISPLAFSLIFSTLYLRYHYLIDLVVGASLAFAFAWFAPKAVEWWERLRLSEAGDRDLVEPRLVASDRP